jgi:hypothetical protein
LFTGRIRDPLDPDYRAALAAFAIWRAPAQSPARRVAALEFSCDRLHALCAQRATYARLSTLARAALEAGRRAVAVQALQTLVRGAIRERAHFSEPFWPAAARYDRLEPASDIDACFVAAAAEQLERSGSFSSFFGGCSPQLDWLCAQPFVSAEMERRRVLHAARAGRPVLVPPRLLVPAADHLNAEVWRAGLIPNTGRPRSG